MAHTVLARKWRPKKFSDLVGQKSTVTILQNIIASNRLHHAYLLTGTRGVGKTTIARIIAKALNCLTPEHNEPCGKCENCTQIDSGRFVDVIEIDAASNTGVDNIREVLENAQYAPTSGKYKIYIIDEVHMLSKSAFNAMLKTLEEPPAHVIFILATTDPQKVPITVLSRCLQLKLRNLLAEEITLHLANVLRAENYVFEDNAIALLGEAANGSMRDALSLTDQAIAFGNGNVTSQVVQQMLGISDDSNIIELLESITSHNSNKIVTICQRLNSEGANLENILEQVNSALFNIGLIQLSSQPDAKPALKALAQKISLQDCQLYFEISNLGLEQIRKINNKYPILTMTLLRMVAFTIGSSEYKQIIIENNNCHTTVTTTIAEVKSSVINLPVNNTETNYPTIQTVEAVTAPTANTVENQQLVIQMLQAIENPQANSAAELSPPWEEEVSFPQLESAQVDESNELVIDEPEIVHHTEIPPVIDTTIEKQPLLTSQSPNSSPVFSSWLEFVTGLNIAELPPNVGVVMNNAAQIGKIVDDELKLQLADTYRRWVDATCVDWIERVLFETYGKHFDISFDFTVELNTSGSRKEFEKIQSEQKQQAAEEAIMNDPIVLDLMNNFAAKVSNISPAT